MKAHGGDLIETTDGRTGRVTSTMFSLVGHETEYALDGSRFETGPDGKYASADRSRRAYESEIARILEHGRHDYQPGGSARGLCWRCDVRKAEHG